MNQKEDRRVIPGDCRHTWAALRGDLDPELHARRGGWYSSRDLNHVTGRPSSERKARKLRQLGLVDWRRVPDRQTGGIFVEFRVAAGPGAGREVAGSPAPAVGRAPDLADSEQRSGSLFDLPPAREAFERSGKATR